MPVKKITKNNLQLWLGKIIEDGTLFAPAWQKGHVLKHVPVTDSEKIIFDFYNTEISPKGLFFPQTEELFRFKTGKELELQVLSGEEKERVIFGLRPCDIKALEALDPVFDGNRNDTCYTAHRNRTLIIGIACREALPTCFCNAFEIDPVSQPGADLMLIEHEGNYLVEEITEKGKNLANRHQDLFDQSGDELESVKKENREQLEKQLQHQISPARAKDAMDKDFELPYWDEISRKCLGCGICTFVCPTCHCFDIFDCAPDKTEGSRYRCWDSCMFGDFTKMAGGHNPRPTKKERVRNRFMHKIKYHLDRYDTAGCVGCGRCTAKCPVNMDITRIITDLGEVN